MIFLFNSGVENLKNKKFSPRSDIFTTGFGHIIHLKASKRDNLIIIETKKLRDFFSETLFSNHFFAHKNDKFFLLEI